MLLYSNVSHHGGTEDQKFEDHWHTVSRKTAEPQQIVRKHYGLFENKTEQDDTLPSRLYFTDIVY